MKKRGFTLAEILVAVTIIAVIAAIAAPIFNKIKPDKYKLKVLNYYASITDNVNSLLEDETIYYTATSNGVPICVGLGCTHQPITAPYNSDAYQGASKFRNLMKSKLGLDDNMTDEKGTVFDISDADADGNYHITIDLNSEGNNCTYDPTSCKTPDRFSFLVSQGGNVLPGDALTYAYLKNATSRDRNADLRDAANMPNLNTTSSSSNTTGWSSFGSTNSTGSTRHKPNPTPH